ncbi:hypothetical protein PoB_000441200 [Plakobranchus ocellatus]|uniref:Uncharacterized protein n=1 Tax=Plakobranchus ocellatus TaxID=259542 RepID=A0AAV3Y637_9GAST|nr:hypothetical protein PoB_000441200 [Plakobranchus ocellatus]
MIIDEIRNKEDSTRVQKAVQQPQQDRFEERKCIEHQAMMSEPNFCFKGVNVTVASESEICRDPSVAGSSPATGALAKFVVDSLC